MNEKWEQGQMEASIEVISWKVREQRNEERHNGVQGIMGCTKLNHDVMIKHKL